MKLALSMLVWNEAKVVGRAIDSIKEHLDCYCIVIDSRTTDNSKEVILEHMGDIPGEIIYREFDDFDKQRNAALEPLKDKTDWVLILDADEICNLNGFSRDLLQDDWAYFTLVSAGVSQHSSIRLFNYHKPWYWSGAIHNYLECPGYTISPTLPQMNIIHIHDGHRSKLKRKAKDDLKKLKILTEQYPDNERYWFYYAQTLREEGHYKKAIAAYAERLKTNKYPEETWFSMFMTAICYTHLNDWDNMIGWTMRAYDFRPHRSEPLYYAMVVARDNGLHNIHFMLSRIAIEIPMPKGETLFVEKDIYNWKAKFEHAIACYYNNHKERALKAFVKMKDEFYDEMPPEFQKQCNENISYITEDLFPTDITKRPIFYNPGMSTFGDNYIKNHNFRRVHIDKADTDGVLWFGIYSENEYDAILRTTKGINLHWCGSDVLWCKADKVRMGLLSRKPNIYHTCENEVQQQELAEESIQAHIHPMFSESIGDYSPSLASGSHNFDVVVYTPSRHELYNVAMMIDVAAGLPNLKFAFIGDREGLLTRLPDNVTNLGWIDQEKVKDVLQSSKIYLRITEHDAFPDLTVKALLLGKRVVTNWNYYGTDVVEKTREDIISVINNLINVPVRPEYRTFYAENGFLNNWSKILKHDYTNV